MASMAETDAPASSEPLEADTDSSSSCPARVVRCEKVLRARTGRVLLVLDRIHRSRTGLTLMASICS